MLAFKRVNQPQNVDRTVIALDKLIQAMKQSPAEKADTIKSYEAELAEWKKLKANYNRIGFCVRHILPI